MPSRTRRPQVNCTSPWPTAAREQSRKRRADLAEDRARAAEAENKLMRQLLAGKAV